MSENGVNLVILGLKITGDIRVIDWLKMISKKNLFFPISVHDVGDDTVYHFIEERLAQEAVVTDKDIVHIEHADDVGHEIGGL